MRRVTLLFVALFGLCVPAFASAQLLPETQTRSGGAVVPADPHNAETPYKTVLRLRWGSDVDDGRGGQTAFAAASIVPSNIKGLEVIGSYRFRDVYINNLPFDPVTSKRWFPSVGGGTIAARYTRSIFSDYNDLAVGAEGGVVLNAFVKQPGGSGLLRELQFQPTGVGPFVRALVTYHVPDFTRAVKLSVHTNAAYYRNDTWSTFFQNCESNESAPGQLPSALCQDASGQKVTTLRDQRLRYGLEVSGDEGDTTQILWGIQVEAELMRGKLRPFIELTGRPLVGSWNVEDWEEKDAGVDCPTTTRDCGTYAMTAGTIMDPGSTSIGTLQTSALRLTPGVNYDVLPSLRVFAALDWTLAHRAGAAYVNEVEQVIPLGPEIAGFVGVTFFPVPSKTRTPLERSRRSFGSPGGGGGTGNGLGDPPPRSRETVITINDEGSGDPIPAGTKVKISTKTGQSWESTADSRGRVRIPGLEARTMVSVEAAGYTGYGIELGEDGNGRVALERLGPVAATAYIVRVTLENATEAMADKIGAAGYKAPGDDKYKPFAARSVENGVLILKSATPLPAQFRLAIRFTEEFENWSSRTVYDSAGPDTDLGSITLKKRGGLRAVGGVTAVQVAPDEYIIRGVSFRFKKDLAALEPGSEAQIRKLVSFWRDKSNKAVVDKQEGRFVIRYPAFPNQGILEKVVAKNRARQVADQLKAGGLRAQDAPRTDGAKEPAVEIFLIWDKPL